MAVDLKRVKARNKTATKQGTRSPQPKKSARPKNVTSEINPEAPVPPWSTEPLKENLSVPNRERPNWGFDIISWKVKIPVPRFLIRRSY